jgi:hypothetical protein
MNSSNDQDDFQFRPLTEGLGFQKKTEKKIERKSFLDMDMAMDLTSPLPRKSSEARLPDTSIPARPAQNTVDEILKTLNQKKNFDFADKATLTEKPKELFKSTRIDFSASLLDAMLITAGTLFCLIVLLLVTNVDLFANLYHPDSQGLIYLSLVTLVAGVSWIYLVSNRIFLGFTPGEWVFDQRLGKPEQMGSVAYALKTVLRTSVIIATGYILFPILSLLFNKDLLGQMMGLELVRKNSH